jgi:hypothetical protein
MRLLKSGILLVALVFMASPSGAQTGAEVYGSDVYWNATPNDVNNLLKGMKETAGADFRMDIRTLGEISADPEKNPVLYRTGHYRFSFTPAERQLLREYMLKGGMMIFETGLGSLPFYRSVTNELRLIFPEQPLQRLSSDHPVFHSFHDVNEVEYTPAVRAAGYRGNEPWFDGVEINCRVVALVSRWGLAVGWQGEVKDEYQAYLPESAFKLGVNILTYATSMRAWAQNSVQSMQFVNRAETASDFFNMGQVVYDGVWKTRHAGISALLQSFNQRTGVPVKFGLRDMRLTDESLFDTPVLYMTGHEHFELREAEISALRLYLENGGLLLAEACCGRKGFDLAFRQMVRKVFPDRPLRVVPPDAELFRVPNNVQWIGVTPALMQDLGAAGITPRMESVDVDGRFAILYSPLGMAGGWEMSPSPYARSYDPAGATKLGENLLMYSITH